MSRPSLIDALWGGEAPDTATKTPQSQVVRVRRAQLEAGPRRLEAAVLAGDPELDPAA